MPATRLRRPLAALARRPHVPGPAVPPVPAQAASPQRASLVAAAIYDDGRRTATFDSLAETFRALRSRPGGMAWIGMDRPEPSDLARLADEFDLHELAVEDAIVAHQRPKLERYGDTLFVVLRAARYLDDVEEVEFGELHVFVGPDFVATVRHSDSPDLAAVRRRLESQPDILALGPEAVLYAILDAVVDAYAPVVAGLENDIDEIEFDVFAGGLEVSRRIYELSREVVEFLRSARPLQQILAALTGGFDKYGVDVELQRHLRDVADHVTEAVERVEGFRAALRDILTVNSTLVAQRQNEEMKALSEASNSQNEEVKKISAWAAILFAPTLVGTVYGMNFDVMPELHWRYGYLFAVGAMAVVSVVLYGVFKLRRWI
ncbi:magnesium and cobalt transport protein CorA [Cellulomonas sp. JH27-2]|uniref:magnesium and cobalt transport protein CorA n=1 Tax=Cellulomonas sp. JH27-2 TaxID=2774139 RepID=UPI00177EA04E|nr:magnesium and cobalt transport protein CorA [Cellulomonas sp. JH27-2]MBD8060324.1 magnesium and cobalt transport protein CorA [Cellulomonas sp. JH27-2]